MQAQDLMAEFSRAAEKPGEWLAGWKARTGKKVIGCFPMYVPEEVIHAAGMHPVNMLGDDQPVSLAHQYVHSYMCHPVRSNFDLGLRGGLGYMDGMVSADICDQAKRLASLWKFYHTFPFVFHLQLPKRLDTPTSLGYLTFELKRFGAALGKFSGQMVTEEALRSSIKLYNRTRSLLRDIYRLREERPQNFTPAEVAAVVTAAMVMPKEELNPLLEQYLEAKRKESPSQKEGLRVVLWGNPCEDMEPGFMEMLGEVGALVVADDILTGYRYFAVPVAEEGDPWQALARAHLDTPPCPTRHHPGRSWAEFLVREVRRTEAKGAIIVLQKFCEIHAFEYPEVKRRLSKEGIPHLMLETDHSGATARVKTRLEAFMEVLR